MEDSEQVDSQSRHIRQHLLSTNNSSLRKISQSLVQSSQRPNFLIRHQTQEYSVLRVYINSLSSEQVRLYYSKFTPKVKEGTVCIVHGFAESTDDYIQMAEYFARNRFVVNMVDLRSFGYSGGRRVNESLEGILSDIQNLLRRCCEIGLPTYIVSHGFGSLLVLALLQQNTDLPISGVVALSPIFSLPFFNQSGFISKCLVGLLSWLLPDLLISNRMNPTSLTNNPYRLTSCFEGVFSYQYITISMVQEYTALCESVMRQAHLFTYPLFVCYGGEDSIQPKAAVKQFYQLSGSKQKSSFVFKKGFHQLFKDQHVEQQLLPKILEWMLDVRSNKNQLKWGKTSSFNLSIGSTVPFWLKYAAFGLIAIIIALLLRFRRSRNL